MEEIEVEATALGAMQNKLPAVFVDPETGKKLYNSAYVAALKVRDVFLQYRMVSQDRKALKRRVAWLESRISVIGSGPAKDMLQEELDATNKALKISELMAPMLVNKTT